MASPLQPTPPVPASQPRLIIDSASTKPSPSRSLSTTTQGTSDKPGDISSRRYTSVKKIAAVVPAAQSNISSVEPRPALHPGLDRAEPAPQQRTPLPTRDVMAMSSVVSPVTAMDGPPKTSMTSREWVIPPRPKPGRKPATDTPPTKRKAQNRAAQRAFRERRAARVGELEEQLDQEKKDFEQQEVVLREQVRSLELELESFRSKCLLLEGMLERERKDRVLAETQLESTRRQSQTIMSRSSSYSMGLPGQSHSRPLPPRHESAQYQITQQTTTVNATKYDTSTNGQLDCTSCGPGDKCACADAVLESTNCGKCGFGQACQCLDELAKTSGQGQELKRPLSPAAPVPMEKRQRPTLPPLGIEPQARFQPSQTVSIEETNDVSFFKDNCGFCKDGTYCVCADAAMATPAMTPTDTLPPITQQTQTPPPEVVAARQPLFMEMTAEGAVKLPPRKTNNGPAASKSRGCGSTGPGTCDQCRADPKSGLFCRLMAANFERSGGSSGGCCGGKGAGGGCCKSKATPESRNNNNNNNNRPTLPSLPSLGLSCAEAYQTLASHRNFERAADDIGSWLPKLKATPRAEESSHAQRRGMMPIEVEAASIMSVLKDFDVRFGRGGT